MITYKHPYSNTALIWACTNKMENVAIKIIKHIKDYNIFDNIKDTQIKQTVFNIYINYEVDKKIKLLSDSDELKTKIELNKELEIRNKNLEKNLQKINNCMCCNEITDNNIIMKNCSHGFPICNECVNNLPNNNGEYKCPYCKCNTAITKLYFMN